MDASGLDNNNIIGSSTGGLAINDEEDIEHINMGND
jgi:hypothetical protein